MNRSIHRIRTLPLKLLAVGLLALAGPIATLPACDNSEGPEAEQVYRCPMHPDITEHEPGECPICGMDLVPVDDGGSDAEPSTGEPSDGESSAEQDHEDMEMAASETAPADGEREIAHWVAPMDSSFTSPTPGESPMGMDLVPVYKDQLGAAGDVTGRATIEIGERMRQLIGIRLAPARVTDAVRTIRTVGFVDPDENRIHHIHTRTPGWLEEVHVHAVGERVERGQLLYELYSPELVATQRELFSARAAGNTASVAAARQRLRNWNVADRDIRRIERSGRVWQAVPFRSGMSGWVHHFNALHGMYVRPEQELYMINNLERIWVLGEFYEADLPLLAEGTTATVVAPDGERLAGRIEHVYPTVDEQSRTVAARLELANPDLRLRPGMYVDFLYRVELGRQLVVPRDAILRTGTRTLAFVALGDGRFEPREVALGTMADEGYIIESGLHPGERVVAQATFMIDSESSLNAALADIGGGN